MIRRPPRSTHCQSSAASDVYKRQARGKGTSCGSPSDDCRAARFGSKPVSYTHLRAHETSAHL
eukprot:8792076-Alexandrium_andersonii.AAC.1